MTDSTHPDPTGPGRTIYAPNDDCGTSTAAGGPGSAGQATTGPGRASAARETGTALSAQVAAR